MIIEEVKKTTCFIATAAYGSPYNRYVTIFRDFKEKYFMNSKLGIKFVHLYYKYSPFAANLIAKNKVLKRIVRIYLLPLVGISYLNLYLGPIFTGTMISFIFAFLFLWFYFFKRKA